MMKRLISSFLFIALLGMFTQAGSPPPKEGMWLPLLVERLNYVDMQKMGLNLTPEEMYDVNNSSLKDAIVGLASGSAPSGYFCTAEVVSPKGLILTNHHCGFSAIQEQSSTENDYLSNGFWAMNHNEELSSPGVTASFLVRMEDVTEKVKGAFYDGMDETQRQDAIASISAEIEEEAAEEGKFDPVVKSFFNGNEFYLFVYITYLDVRLVGAPPSSIGKFGGDTDNWEWPRHTGDFAMMRIYTAPDGNPAEYSEDNIPLKPKHYLPVSLNGVQKDDFAMIWGFPGTTDRYLTSYGVKLALDETNENIIKIRDNKLKIIKEAMNTNPEVKIQYAAEYAQTANYWKYYIGQTKGLKALNVYDKKLTLEKRFTDWVNEKESRKNKYGDALNLIEQGYKDIGNVNMAQTYFNEAIFSGPAFIGKSFNLYMLYRTLNQYDTADKDDKSQFEESIEYYANMQLEEADGMFEDYHMPTDKKLFATNLDMYSKNVPEDFHPEFFSFVKKKFKGDFYKYADYVYEKSFLLDKAKYIEFLKEPTFKEISKDPGFQVTLDFIDIIRMIYPQLNQVEIKINKGRRLFIEGLMKMQHDKTFYPDANSTLRMTYGKVKGYFPKDAVRYHHVTYLSGVMEKEDPTNEEFIVDEKLKKLYDSKDYGPYGEDGRMVVCFLTTNDITGGNSGSPVINGDGHLIGIAFDGNWEAMSGDIAFEVELQRTISVDIRYVLFVIDKFAGAKYLVDEMTLIKVKPEKKKELKTEEIKEEAPVE